MLYENNKLNLLTEEQSRAISVMEQRNTCLTGAAGTGKSFTLKCYLDMHPDTMVLAFTGITALAVRGKTIHSFFRLKPRIVEPDFHPLLKPETVKTLCRVESVVIEEFSMVRSDLFTAVERILRENAVYPYCLEPFGGKHVIVSGDPGQLSPVAKLNKDEPQYLTRWYGSVYPHNTPAWQNAGFTYVNLRNIHRQSDREYCTILNTIRGSGAFAQAGRLDDAVNRLNRLVTVTGTPPENATVLCSHNETADYINRMKDAELGGEPELFLGWTEGVFTESLPTPEELYLRPGSYVMIVANKPTRRGYEYVNGHVGRVCGIDHDRGIVRVELAEGRTVEVERYCWSDWSFRVEETPEGGEVVRHFERGRYRQMPLRLANAVTCHKSQGKTIYGRVHIDLAYGPFTAGQLYVALSRSPAVECLSLSRPLTPRDVVHDQEISDFLAYIEAAAISGGNGDAPAG